METILLNLVKNMIASPLPPDQQNGADSDPDAEYVRIPSRYRAPATSELSYEIIPGDQVRDFDLTAE